MSESVEMYLVMTALLRADAHQPVPVSLLASKLAVSPVSANEMCRKLGERGLVAYQPYKGVTLTEAGEAMAQQVLTRRRLWVVFLVENLGIDPQEADALACQLEHITSDRLVTSLKVFLEKAPAIRSAQSAARLNGETREAQLLTACTAGTRGYVANITAEPAITSFLHAQGVQPEALVEVLAVGTDGAVLLGCADQQVALAHTIAAQITVAPLTHDHAVRHNAWERCSAFWNCLRADLPCARELHPAPAEA